MTFTNTMPFCEPAVPMSLAGNEMRNISSRPVNMTTGDNTINNSSFAEAFQDFDMRKIMLFLAQVPSGSNLKLMFQLALASDVPAPALKQIQQKVDEGISLTDLLTKEHLLTQLLMADEQIGEAEENMLYETIDKTGIVAPTNIPGTAEYLLDVLTDELAEEIEHLPAITQ